MSIDFDVVCKKCKVYRHFGQWFAGGDCIMGFGKNDIEHAEETVRFCMIHAHNCGADNVVIMSFHDRYMKEFGDFRNCDQEKTNIFGEL